MNKMKKFASIATAVLMTACMAAPMTMSLTSSAALVEYTMSLPSGIPTDVSIENLKAVKIFNATYDSTNNVLNIAGWADGVTLATITDKLASGSAVKTELSGITDDAVSVAAKLAAWDADTTNNGSAKVEEFAKAAAEALKNSNNAVIGTFANNKATFEDLGVGYYVVLCDLVKDSTPYDATSLGMLTVTGAGKTEIGLGEAKVGLPEVVKKVKEDTKNDNLPSFTVGGISQTTDVAAGWNDVADYDIGDAVPFKLYGSLPVDLAKYGAYYYKFTDTIDTTMLSIADDATVKVTIGGTKTITATLTNGKYVSEDKNVFINKTATGLEVVIENIKKYDTETAKLNPTSDIVTVEYSATLTTDAVIGLEGQVNAVKLTYSNNPNFNYTPDSDSDTPETPGGPDTPETGETPEDKVIVFTYELDVTKKFFEANGDEIADTGSLKDSVKFELKKDISSGESIKFLNNKPSAVDTASAELILDSNNKIILQGLDDGTYYLVETAAPTGFNKAEPIKIVITGGTVNTSEWNGVSASTALESFSYTVGDGSNAKTVYQGKDGEGNKIDVDDVSAGKYANIDSKAKADVENKKGSSLPSTGGIGTTLFYVGGGAMVAVAGVFLITKKRMGKKED